MGEFGIGQPVPREEDPYLVRGAGRYVDDVAPAATGTAYVLRSPHSHARIRNIDAARAKALPGVLLVLTGARSRGAAHSDCSSPGTRASVATARPRFISPQPLLARDRVRYIGDPVALIVAETIEQAKDAAEAIEVEYEPAAGGDRDRGRGRAGRAGGVGRVPRQPGLHARARRRGSGRAGLRERRASSCATAW